MERITKKLENEMRLLAYYNMRNHIAAMALKEDANEFYRLLYAGMKRDHGEKLPDSLISCWGFK